MKSGKIKQDNICFKKGIPDTKFQRRHNVRPVSLGRSGGMEHAEGGSRGRGGLRPSIRCGRRDREWGRETDWSLSRFQVSVLQAAFATRAWTTIADPRKQLGDYI